MRSTLGKPGTVLCMAILATLCAATISLAQNKDNKNQTNPDSNASVRLQVEVTGGESSTPVESASVYVRYLVKHKMGKDETIEMNLKTNRAGIVLVPGVPRGEITLQVVADRWKPYGQKVQATEDGQTIKVHLEKPPRWY